MKTFVLARYGDATAVHAADIPEPSVAASEALVRVRAASVNPLDLKISNGDLKAVLPIPLPVVLGNDIAGAVVAVGAGVTRSALARLSTNTPIAIEWPRSRSSSRSIRAHFEILSSSGTRTRSRKGSAK